MLSCQPILADSGQGVAFQREGHQTESRVETGVGEGWGVGGIHSKSEKIGGVYFYRSKLRRTFVFAIVFLATLVALHFTPVSKWVSRWVVVSD